MLAVLPFENLTGDPDQEHLGDGMTEELIAQLSRMDPSRLGVIARTSAMQFKKTTKRTDRIGSELGVSYLVEGSVRTAGSRIRIAVQLIEAQSESHLWAEQYERDAKDLLTLQREVAEAVTRQITTSLGVTRSNVNADTRRHSTIAEAYEHYLRGRYHWGRDTAEGHEKAKEHFRRAIDLDPSYALAYSGLADTYMLLGSDGFLPMREAYPLGRAAALKALELDDMLGEAHNSVAAINFDYYWDFAEAERHFRRAIDLNPNYEPALRNYSFYLACMGRPEEALAFAERGRRLDPVSPGGTVEPRVDPLLRPSLRRGHCRVRRDARARSGLRSRPCHVGASLRRQGHARSSRRGTEARPGVSWVLALTSRLPTPGPSPGLDAGARRWPRWTNCGAS